MPTPISELQSLILGEIPMARAMELTLRDYGGAQLTITAPLGPNINDKGCAFGGSLVSLMTLAGWGVVVLKLKDLGRECDVYVQDSTVRYLAPVWSQLIAIAQLVDGENWDDFAQALTQRGRARANVSCRVPLEDGRDACTMQARFVAIVRD
jgi:thioesterase domain-containing protein